MSHGHDGGHDNVPAAEAGGHGPAEIPPVPSPRRITPARDDYDMPFVGRGLAWPLVWLVVAVTLHGAALRLKAAPYEEEAHGHAAPGTPGDAHHGAPEAEGRAPEGEAAPAK